jgi:GMP synthase (glutamine-hydrolysing)
LILSAISGLGKGNMRELLAVLDFGSQYTQVIVRRIRENKVYSKIYPFNTPAETLRNDGVKGIILSGGPSSVLKPDAPMPDPEIFDLGVPIMGICYGLQLMGLLLGGKVQASNEREFGRGTLNRCAQSMLFSNLPESFKVWNSHGDRLEKMPDGFSSIAVTENAPYAVIENPEKNFFGLQFHPEVVHSEYGNEIINNFLLKVCNFRADWVMSNYIEQKVQDIRKEVGKSKVVLGLSGGVDSSVAAALIHRAIGNQLKCVFVDNGLLRKNERLGVERLFGDNFDIDLTTVDASREFLDRLAGVTDPETKRKIIGNLFVEVFDESIAGVDGVDFLAQGTLYPDIIESVPIDGNPAALIKSHHNVGGLPKDMKLRLLEPLKELFKDEVRLLGEELGLPKTVVWRQPFPGPGLAVRVMGEITKERLDILREADAVFQQEMREADLYYKVWQSFCVFLPVQSVGVMGDERTYEYVIALRCVESQDAMTADWARLPYDLLGRVSSRIINEVKGVNRVVYDISSKPPSTIEWE